MAFAVKNKVKLVCAQCGKQIASRPPTLISRYLLRESRCQCRAALPEDAGAAEADDGSGEPLTEGDRSDIANIDDRYEVVSRLGRGGMGAVFKVRHREIGKTFAVKVLSENLVSDAVQLKRFKHEAQAASRLNHPHLVAVYDYGTGKSGRPYIMMDYLRGSDLQKRIKQEGYLDQEQAVDILIQVCEGIAHAHGEGVLHRDIKPSNILLTKRDGIDFVKIVDFGIAKMLPNEGRITQDLTQTGEVFGSPPYMSPEQCQGLNLDARSDIYSIGCVLYEMVSGKPPFEGANAIQTILKHVSEAAVPLSDVCQASDDISDVALHCLEKEPADRYQSVDELLADLRRIRDGQPILLKKGRQKRRPAFTVPLRLVVASSILLVFLNVLVWSLPGILSQASRQIGPMLTGDQYEDSLKMEEIAYRLFTSGDYENAIPYLEFGIKNYGRTHKLNSKAGRLYQADNYQHIGKCYLMLNKLKRAQDYYRKALELYRPFGRDPHSMIAEAIKDYGAVLVKMGRKDAAERMAREFAESGKISEIP